MLGYSMRAITIIVQYSLSDITITIVPMIAPVLTRLGVTVVTRVTRLLLFLFLGDTRDNREVSMY